MTLKMVTTAFVLLHPTLHGVTLPQAELDKIPGYIADASGLIEGYLQRTFPDPPPTDTNPVPEPARIVCRRVVARALIAPEIDPRFDTYASTMGPLSHTKHVAADVLGGGVWLTRQDKLILDGIPATNDAMNIPLFAFTPCPAAPPNWWQMTPAAGR